MLIVLGGEIMKNNMSVIILFQKQALKAILPVLAAMPVLEGILFFTLTGTLRADGAFWLEELVEKSAMWWVFWIAFAAVCILLIRAAADGTGRPSYSLQRLAISKQNLFACRVLALVITFLLLWAVQILTVFLLLSLVCSNPAYSCFSSQSVFLAFYRNDFLHNLLPMEDWLCWLRNLALFFGLSTSAAYCTLPQDESEKKSNLLFLLHISSLIISFSWTLGSNWMNVLAILCSGCCTVSILCKIFRKEAV